MTLFGPARTALAVLAVLLPVAIAVAVALAAGWVEGLGALLLLAAAALGGLIAVRPLHRAGNELAAYLRNLSESEDAAPESAASSSAARELMLVAGRLHNRWRRRTQALARDLAAARAVPESLRDPVIVLDRESFVVAVNPAAKALFGSRMTGRDLAASVRNPEVLEAVEAVLAGGRARTVEYAPTAGGGRVFELWVLPIEGDDGGAVLSLHDITALKRVERMRADFVANASHELRTPLSSLLGFIETLRGPARDDPEAREHFLGIMHDQASRMSRLVSDLLSLSRIEVDEHTPPAGAVDLAATVRATLAGLEMKAAKRGVALELEVEDDLPPVAGDEDQLAQVAQNLVDNAIKYTRADTPVTVALKRTHGGVVLSVRDRGEGIAREHLPRLTERFYRVDPARSRALGGTGLGLAIVKHIVARHRGRLDIGSEVGRGSVFTVTLPAP